MKKYVAMIALSLAIAGTVNAQNDSRKEKGNNKDNPYSQNRKDKVNPDGFKKNSNGRGNVSPEQRAIQRTEMWSQKLNLSQGQTKQLQALNLKQAQQLAALRNNTDTNEARQNNNRQEAKRLQADWDNDFKKILNKKQYAQYEAERKQMQAQRSNRPGRENGNNARSRKTFNG